MKLCAKCGREWPTDGNFCPIDGSELVPIPVEDDAADDAKNADGDPPPAQAAAVDETLGDVGWEGADSKTAKPTRKPVTGQREFSETQWFMVGADPEALVDEADHNDLENLQERYGRDSSIPTNERRKFTLRSQEKHSGDEDEENGGGS